MQYHPHGDQAIADALAAVITRLSAPPVIGRPPTKLVAVQTPVIFVLPDSKVTLLFTVTVVPLPIGCILSTLTMLISFFSYLC